MKYGTPPPSVHLKMDNLHHQRSNLTLSVSINLTYTEPFDSNAVMPGEVNVNIICGRNVVMEVHDKMRIGGVR